LVRAGGWIVRSLSNLARILGWREFVVASIVMALASSLPELFVGITASFANKPQLAVGNILGSNIIALTLLMSIGTILAKRLEFKGRTIQKARFFACFFTLFPLILMLDRSLSRLDGVILLIAFLFYLKEIIKDQRKFSKIFNQTQIKPLKKLKLFFRELGIFFVSLCFLLLSAKGIVFASTKIASGSGLSLIIIGILGIALGTSLPEIAFAFKSIKLGHKEMILGDAIGSVVANSGLILGLAIIISPFTIHNFALYVNGVLFSFLATVLFLVFSMTKNEITRKEGFFLLLIYLFFFFIESLIEIFRF
jgi:cation:H+ antiporter